MLLVDITFNDIFDSNSRWVANIPLFFYPFSVAVSITTDQITQAPKNIGYLQLKLL